MSTTGPIVMLVYAALLIVGGFMGFRAGSKISLIAGGTSGVLMLVAYFVTRSNLTVGLWVGAVLALLLSGNFIQRYMATGKLMPAGGMAVISVLVTVVLAVAALQTRGG